MKAGFYSIECNNYIFELSVTKYDESYSFQFGEVKSNDGPCVELTYDVNNPKILVLESLKHHAKCAVNKNLERSSGTIIMIKCIFKLIVTEFPSIKRISLKDVADFNCDGKRITLSYHYLCLYGQTWYEKHFQAIAKSKHYRHTLDEFRKYLKKRHGKFENWHAYFHHKKATEGCNYFIEHQDDILKMLSINLIYSEWYIRTKDIIKYDVEIKKKRVKYLQSGGWKEYVRF